MSNEQKRIQEGPPIWVESLMTPEEWKARYKMWVSSSTHKEVVQYDPNYHKGGKWRAGMGEGFTIAEIQEYNRKIDQLHNFMRLKSFQRRPEYGTHSEAKP